MNYTTLAARIRDTRSYLCVGLDTDILKLPAHMAQTPQNVLRFNKKIIDATLDTCVAYKINTAFYEALGAKGWEILAKTFDYIPDTHLRIADAKRGDIGNTSDLYARAFFESMQCDAITVAPYMGSDSVGPFLKHKDKWTIVLALTSNAGAKDFQLLTPDQKPVYQHVMEKVQSWGSHEQTMFVCGATRTEQFKHLRQISPNHFFLVPGVGAQGGDLQEISLAGFNSSVGLLVNASRSIIFASNGKDFAKAARKEAQKLHLEMDSLLKKAGL